MRSLFPARTVVYSAVAVSLVTGLVIMQNVLSAWEIPEGDIIFSHAQHVGKRSMECASCHASVFGSSSSSDRNLPEMGSCFGCHDDDQASSDCKLCHHSVENPLALGNPEREIIFSHKDHLESDRTCAKCHEGVEKAVKMSQTQFPDMWVCMECHNGKKQTSECGACHKEPGRMKKVFHAEGWDHRHKFEAARQPERCGLCHESDESCEECHLGDNLQQLTHGLNYEFDHSLDARGKEKDCSACHDEAAFCAPCHLQNEVMPEDHSLLSWNGSRHAEAAQRDIEACISCHETDDVTCLECHAEHGGELEHDEDFNTTGPAPAFRPDGMLK